MHDDDSNMSVGCNLSITRKSVNQQGRHNIEDINILGIFMPTSEKNVKV